REWRKIFEPVDLAERDSSCAIDDEDGAPAGPGERCPVAENAVAAAHFAVRQEIAAQRVVERADLALPDRGVHDGVNADADDLAAGKVTLALGLILRQLLGADG